MAHGPYVVQVVADDRLTAVGLLKVVWSVTDAWVACSCAGGMDADEVIMVYLAGYLPARLRALQAPSEPGTPILHQLK